MQRVFFDATVKKALKGTQTQFYFYTWNGKKTLIFDIVLEWMLLYILNETSS